MTDGEDRIYKLLSYALTDANVFAPNEKIADELLQDCFDLCSRDNVCTTLSNSKGSLCSTYPGQLIIPIKQKVDEKADLEIDQSTVANKEFEELVVKGRFARTRGRFPIPVLLIGDKFVCRSSTLARSPEIYTRTGYQYFIQGEASGQPENTKNKSNGISASQTNGSNGHLDQTEMQEVNGGSANVAPFVNPNGNSFRKKHMLMPGSVQPVNGAGQNKEWLLDKMRKSDIDILNALKVNMICDLMVENKKVKFGLNVTSSEKVDRQNRYGEFHLMSIPYPGCEFFADYSNNNYKGVGLKFDWKQNFVDAELQIPEVIGDLQGIRWKNYMQWDLVTLTQNYLKLLLKCLTLPGSTGILLHCISGWDRTPLFVSLLRLSLWADGVIHQSLNAEEIVYLTLAYDWLLFSHQFSDRIYKSEEIMHFCFEFLKDIMTADYSLLPLIEKSNPFSLASTDIDELFSMDNLSGGIDCESVATNCSQTNGHHSNEEADFEEVYSRGECDKSNGMHTKSLEASNEAALNMQEIETCLNCIVSNVSGTQSGDSTYSGDSFTVGKRKCEHYCNKTCNGNPYNGLQKSAAAILPLQTADTVTPKPLAHHRSLSQVENEYLKSQENCMDETVRSPRSALSSSYETAKDEISSCLNNTNSVTSAKATLFNSLNLKDDSTSVDSSFATSEPIPVPSKCLNGFHATGHRSSLSCSVASSVSNPTLLAEPGSSWQMISPSPPDLSSSTVYANSSASSGAQLSHNNSFTHVPQVACSYATGLRLKLEKRKEKLRMAYNVMTPAYSKVVKKQRQLQEQSGFSALMGTLVHLVKRA